MDIAQGNLSPETKYELDLVNGKGIGKVNFKGSQLKIDLNVEFEVLPILEKAKAKVAGTFFASIITLLQSAITAVSSDPIETVNTPTLAGQ